MVFQAKLLIDGLRDGVLIPVSIGAAVLDVLTRSPEGRGLFYRVVALGRASERWIDLWEAGRRLEGSGPEPRDAGSVDEVCHRLEAVLVERERRGGLTASARQQVDRLLDALARPKRDDDSRG